MATRKDNSAEAFKQTFSVKQQQNPYEQGSIYYDMFENNPYADMYYEPTFWDLLGLSNKAKDANKNYQQQYNEYIASIAQAKAGNDYNSPANQASLERQAGLNPDLTGISGTGSMSPMSSPNAGANPALSGESPTLKTLTEMGSILSFALNAYQGINSTILAQNSADIANFNALTESALPFVTQSFAEAFLNNQDVATSVASGKDSFSRQFTSRSNQKRASKAFEHLFYSSRYDLQRKALENYSKFNDEEIKFGARQLFNNNQGGQAVKDFIKEYLNLGVEEFKISLKSNISAKSKQKMLDDFRMRSIERLTDNYRKSNGQDILSGLLLAGMLESSSVSMIGDYKNYLMLSGDKISKDIGGFLSNGYNKFRYWYNNKF